MLPRHGETWNIPSSDTSLNYWRRLYSRWQRLCIGYAGIMRRWEEPRERPCRACPKRHDTGGKKKSLLDPLNIIGNWNPLNMKRRPIAKKVEGKQLHYLFIMYIRLRPCDKTVSVSKTETKVAFEQRHFIRFGSVCILALRKCRRGCFKCVWLFKKKKC